MKTFVEVLDVLRADVRELRVVLQVVVAIGQRRAALDRDRARPASGSPASASMKPPTGPGSPITDSRPSSFGQLPRVCDRVDLREPRLQRIGAELVERGFVHEAGVEVADLLRRAARLLVLVAGQLFDERVEIRFRFLVELDERAVHRPIGGNLRLRQPPAVDVTEQIVLRANGLVERGGIESGLELLCRNNRDARQSERGKK